MWRAQDRARSARSRKNGARRSNRAPYARSNLLTKRAARHENVPAKRADFFCYHTQKKVSLIQKKFWTKQIWNFQKGIQSELMQTIPIPVSENFLSLVWCKSRLNTMLKSKWIRTKFLIRINLNQSELGLIWIYSNIKP